MSMTEKLAYLKRLHHLTTEDISRQSGISVGTLNKIFSGQTKAPAVQHMDRLARSLGIPISYLLDDTLPVECCITASDEDGVVLLSREEVRFLMKFRDLEPRSRRTLVAMAEILLTAPALLAGKQAFRRTFCYTSGGESVNGRENTFTLRPILIPETGAAQSADFAVQLADGSMEPLYPAGSILLCRRRPASRQEYGLYLLNRSSYVRRLCRRHGITKLVSPNLDFKDVVVGPEDCLDCLGAIVGAAHRCKWGSFISHSPGASIV